MALAPSDNPLELIPASKFTLKELTTIYNKSRVDYLVPMPMNIAKMTEYIHVYDINLENSFVAMDEGVMQGLGMLGVRAGRAWITRLGVLPTSRRHGAGRTLMVALLEAAERLDIRFTMLEVIKNNVPAQKLFLKLGFYETGELLILRRPPGPPPVYPFGDVQWMARAEALALLETRTTLPPWTNQTESLHNATDVFCLTVTLPGGDRGWLAFQRQRYMLSRLVIQTEQGDPAIVGRALLAHLHDKYFDLDTQTENIYVNDAHLPAFYEMGYVESFRRVEMYRQK
ncbi:MAG: GNAT family N-acetyltransferase [Chloroflexi bacterium]|nr:GNAT family N-acetyltransferase [Chloroflexota bacterium]